MEGAARARAPAAGARQGRGPLPGVSEGERGLLGVGYAPARVLAGVDRRRGRGRRAESADESDDAARVRMLLDHVTVAWDPLPVDVAEATSRSSATCTAPTSAS